MQENATALYRLNEVVEQLGNIGYHLENLSKGLKLYNEYKGSLDIGIYEAALETFVNSIAGLDEQADNLHTVLTYLKDTIENGMQGK
jgi:exonuclease VII small subunit